MSKDKINIDKLFHQLKGVNYPTDPAGFDEIQNKLNDKAWSDKFNGYEHKNTPDFDALPIAISDNNNGGNAAKAIIISIIALLFLSVSFWVGYSQLSNEDNSSQQTIITIPNEGNLKQLDVKKPTTEINAGAVAENNKENAVERKEQYKNEAHTASLPLSTSHKTNAESFNNQLNKANETSAKLNPNPLTLSVQKNTIKTGEPFVKENISGTSYDELANSENKLPNKNNSILDKDELGSFEGKVITNPFSNSNLVSRKFLVSLTDELVISQDKEKTMRPKLKIPFTPYVALGIGLQSAKNQFTYTKGTNGSAWEVLLGLEKGRSNFYSGFSASEYSFLTTQKRINIYDSFPHKNVNGDTIGWFKRNFRDTTFNSNDKSTIKIASIPLHFQFKIFQYKRFDLAVGAGLNLNFYRQNDIYARDENDYSVTYQAQNPVIKRTNITGGLNTRIGYRVTPFTSLYMKIETFSGQNISKINTFDIKPNGANLKIGLQRFIR